MTYSNTLLKAKFLNYFPHCSRKLEEINFFSFLFLKTLKTLNISFSFFSVSPKLTTGIFFSEWWRVEQMSCDFISFIYLFIFCKLLKSKYLCCLMVVLMCCSINLTSTSCTSRMCLCPCLCQT